MHTHGGVIDRSSDGGPGGKLRPGSHRDEEDTPTTFDKKSLGVDIFQVKAIPVAPYSCAG